MQTQRSRKSSGLKGIEVRNEWCRDGLKMFIGEIDVREKNQENDFAESENYIINLHQITTIVFVFSGKMNFKASLCR